MVLLRGRFNSSTNHQLRTGSAAESHSVDLESTARVPRSEEYQIGQQVEAVMGELPHEDGLLAGSLCHPRPPNAQTMKPWGRWWFGAGGGLGVEESHFRLDQC